jgi:multidrug resistance protein MdtO
MMALYGSIVDRNLATDKLPLTSRTRLTMLAKLMDEAAFGFQNQMKDDPQLRQRCAVIAERRRELSLDVIPKSENHMTLRKNEGSGLLDRVEGAIHPILTMPSDPGGPRIKSLPRCPSVGCRSSFRELCEEKPPSSLG